MRTFFTDVQNVNINHQTHISVLIPLKSKIKYYQK